MCSLISRTNFQWISSNLYDTRTNKPLGCGPNKNNAQTGIPSKIFDHKLSSEKFVKIGLLGLYEENWVREMPSYSGNTYLEVKNFIEIAKKIVKEFKSKNVQLIIALTHQQDVRFFQSYFFKIFENLILAVGPNVG